MEIRLHGRGGQGGVTCAKLLAALYARLGKSVQAFGDYAGERSGAPVRAYVRISDGVITDRNKVYDPDHLVVLDHTLLDPSTVGGLKPGGLLLLNTPDAPEVLAQKYPAFRIATVDATAIARRHGIGSRSVVIVNTTIGGAFAVAMGLSQEVLEAAYTEMGVGSDLPAAREAWAAVRIAEAAEAPAPATASTPAVAASLPKVEDLVDHVSGPAPLLKTGSWRSQMPHYVVQLAPCVAACPAGNDVVGFVQALARSGEEPASRLLGLTNPLAGVCGRVCPAFCMQKCNRCDFDGAVDVRSIERWISDHAPVARPIKEAPLEKRRKVAIVGGGPAGLSAAYTLAQIGHEPVIFEAEPKLGGVLVTGIPTYRLPREPLEREIAGILELGVETRLSQRLDSKGLAALVDQFDAVILAMGLQRLTRLEGPGTDLAGIRQGVHFLHQVNIERHSGATLWGETGTPDHVVVLGGGNTAMDCARSAIRLGARNVTVAYRRTEAEMPANTEEIEEAREEGVTFLFQRAPVGFEGDGSVRALRLAEVEMGEPDASGRRRPVVTDRIVSLECDAVLLALGQGADRSILPGGWKIEQGRVHCEGQPLHVYAAGDFCTSDGTVTHAIGDGRRAATRALNALGEPVTLFERPNPIRALTPQSIRFSHFDRGGPAAVNKEAPRLRATHFHEVSHGLDNPCEAKRCLSCGDCTLCDTCMIYCPDGIIHRNEAGDGYEIDVSYCKGCGICVVECPRGALEMVTG